jgi:hypothetical protein
MDRHPVDRPSKPRLAPTKLFLGLVMAGLIVTGLLMASGSGWLTRSPWNQSHSTTGSGESTPVNEPKR